MVRTAGMFNSNIGSLDFDAPHQVKPEVQSVQVTPAKASCIGRKRTVAAKLMAVAEVMNDSPFRSLPFGEVHSDRRKVPGRFGKLNLAGLMPFRRE